MGRGATKSAADKVAELAQKADSQKRAAQLQEKLDLELMRLAKILNPYQFSINKHSATWEKISNGMNDIPDTPDKGFSERRCRERVTKPVKAYRLKEKPRKGDGTEEKSEIHLLMEFCIEEEDKTENCKKGTVEKEAAMKAVVTQIQMQALRTIVPRREVKSDEEDSPNLRMKPDSSQPKKPAYTKRVVTSSPAVEKRQKPGDASEAYLAARREQHEQDNRTKMEMKDREAERKDREAERKDREEERAVKREKQAYEARKLEMEAADRDRRFEMEKADRQGILDVLKLALVGIKTD